MYLYLIFAGFALLSILEINGGRKITNRVLVIPFLVLFCLAALRWERGTDWQSYKDLFDFVDNTAFLLVYEPGFYYLNYLVKAFTEDYTALLLVQAFIIYIFHYYLIKKYSISPMVSLMVWFGFYMGSIFFVRFNIALTLTLFSFIFIVERKWWKFFICVIVATLFHRTAILFLPGYFFFNRTFSKRGVVLALFASFFLSFVFEKWLGALATANLGIFSDKSAAYLEAGSEEVFGSSKSPLITMLTGASYRVVIVLLIIGFYYKFYKENSFFRGLFNLYFVGICLFIMVVPVSIAMARMSQYYEYLQVFLIPYLILRFKYPPLKFAILLLISAFYLTRLVSNINAYKNLFIPYKSIFNKELPVDIG